MSIIALALHSCSLVGSAAGWVIDDSHSDIMNSYKSKRDVVAAFGIPQTKDTLEGIEIWNYNLGSVSSSNVYVAPSVNRKSVMGTGSTSTYGKYVEFQFDDDQVLRWRSKGVNYRKRTWENILGYSGLTLDLIYLTLVLTNL